MISINTNKSEITGNNNIVLQINGAEPSDIFKPFFERILANHDLDQLTPFQKSWEVRDFDTIEKLIEGENINNHKFFVIIYKQIIMAINSSRSEERISYLDVASKMLQTANKDFEWAEFYLLCKNCLGVSCEVQGEFGEAIEHFNQGLADVNKLGFSNDEIEINKSIILNNLANCYRKTNNAEMEKITVSNLLKQNENLPKSDSGYVQAAVALYGFGISLGKNNQHHEALKYLLEAKENLDLLNLETKYFYYYKGAILRGIATAFANMGDAKAHTFNELARIELQRMEHFK